MDGCGHSVDCFHHGERQPPEGSRERILKKRGQHGGAVVSASPHTTTARGSNLVYKRLFIYIKEWRLEE